MNNRVIFKTENLGVLDNQELRLHIYLEAQGNGVAPPVSIMVKELGMSRTTLHRAKKGLVAKGMWCYRQATLRGPHQPVLY